MDIIELRKEIKKVIILKYEIVVYQIPNELRFQLFHMDNNIFVTRNWIEVHLKINSVDFLEVNHFPSCFSYTSSIWFPTEQEANRLKDVLIANLVIRALKL